jgi:hypothetical protein
MGHIVTNYNKITNMQTSRYLHYNFKHISKSVTPRQRVATYIRVRFRVRGKVNSQAMSGNLYIYIYTHILRNTNR